MGSSMKTGSAFYPPDLIERARKNAAAFGWAGTIRDAILDQARPWLGFSHDQLWEMVFGPDHLAVANSLNNLSEIYYSQGRHDLVLETIRQASVIHRNRATIISFARFRVTG